MRARHARQIRAGIVAARTGEDWSSDWEPLTTDAFIWWHAREMGREVRRIVRSLLRPFGPVEWGTDTWGEILSEPNEAHARSVAGGTGAKLYTRPAMGEWVEVR